MATSRQQPPWHQPKLPGEVADLPPLKIYNSLTRTKNDFVPIKAKEKEVSWYVCGPTVYDDSHLGHARNYVTTDIIRRILRDYFGFKLNFVMNITDVDDKIILRARQQHLLAEFIAKNSDNKAEALGTNVAALKQYLEKNLPLVPQNTPAADVDNEVGKHYKQVLLGGSLGDGPPGDKEAKVKMHINTVLSAVQANLDLTADKTTLPAFYEKSADVLLPYLDSLHGSKIDADDHSIFTKLTKKYENRFMEDVRALNCMDPDHVTRVTEYGPQIIDFVKRIVDNGFAYKTSDGSVYFDIAAFEAAQNHYARLEPWNKNNQGLRADGEGALTKKSSETKSSADFALWKASRPGEPSWPSEWGPGRPGWHIECSAMASDLLGAHIDIHSGGIDLAFPHHDNELAQSEAYWLDNSHTHDHQWVNYFLHMGHLSIQGSKMSKSLKNFTTIREALAKEAWTPRSLRIVFLFGGWKEGIEVTDDVVTNGASWEEKMNNFFIQVHDFLRQRKEIQDSGHGKADKSLNEALEDAKTKTYQGLCDSFNTYVAMTAMSDLATVFFSTDRASLSVEPVQAAAQWITRMVRIFGLDDTPLEETSKLGWSGVSIPAEAEHFVYPLASTRDVLRRKARSSAGITPQDVQTINADAPAAVNESTAFAKVAKDFNHELANLSQDPTDHFAKDILALCDRVRDVDLFDLGVYLEDRDGDQPALVRPVTRELQMARQQRNEKEAEKLRRKEEADAKAREQAEKGRMPHTEMFKTAEFSAWDADGLPTKDAKGEEVNKSRGKRLKKDWDRQKKAHEQWLKTQGGS